ncbi:MAG TPA: hypothetical protein VF275_01730 [Gammaproteobacteria bacterium]
MKVLAIVIAVWLSSCAVVQANEESIVLAAGWLSCSIRIDTDGSVRFSRTYTTQEVSNEQLKALVSQLKFPPHLEDGTPVVYYTGVHLRFRVVQRGERRQMEFGQAFLAPTLYRVAPRPWPEKAWDRGLGGDVVVFADVNGEGFVTEARRIGGDAPDVFTDVALEAVRGTEFVGAAIGDEFEPVASTAILAVYYEPKGRKSSRWAVSAAVPVNASDDNVHNPVYQADLPRYAEFREMDELLTDSLKAWNFLDLSGEQSSIEARVVTRTAIAPAEGRLFLLPNSSAAARAKATR